MLPLALWKSGNGANLNAIVRRAEPIVVTLRYYTCYVREMGNTANQKREPIDCQQNLGVQNEGMKMKFDGSTDFSSFFLARPGGFWISRIWKDHLSSEDDNTITDPHGRKRINNINYEASIFALQQ